MRQVGRVRYGIVYGSRYLRSGPQVRHMAARLSREELETWVKKAEKLSAEGVEPRHIVERLGVTTSTYYSRLETYKKLREERT